MGLKPVSPPVPAAVARAIRSGLLRWYRRHKRDLPWRKTSDPYAIWVSEIMLQQTQVATVLPYYQRFLDRFPDPARLAAADEEEVLALWSGLGYYRRARALHAGAQEVVAHHAGRVPEDPQLLLELPGIGRYTAGAIASIAFGLAEPILDGNVRRVLSRLFAIPGTGIDAKLWTLAETLVRGSAPGDFNQSLMELGATTCTPRAPNCSACPVAKSCQALELGTPEAFPTAKARPEIHSVDVGVAWITRKGRVLLERPGAASPFRGTWDLPSFEGSGDDVPGGVQERHNLVVRPNGSTLTARHGIMNRRLKLSVIGCTLTRGQVAGHQDLRWVDLATLSEQAVSGATLKVARGMLSETPPRSPTGKSSLASRSPRRSRQSPSP